MEGAEIRIFGIPIGDFYAYNDFTSKWELLGYEALFFVAIFLICWAALQFSTLNKR